MKLLNILCASILALCCACCTLIVLIQEDAWLQQHVQHELEALLSKSFACNFRAEVASINFFTGTVVLRNIHVTPPGQMLLEEPAWHWSAEQIQLKVALWASYQQKKICADLTLHRAAWYSTVHDGQLAIMPHLQTFVAQTASRLPFEAQKLTFKQNSFALEHAGNCSGIFNAQAQLHKDGNDVAYRFHVSLHDGMFCYNKQVYSNAMATTLEGLLSLRPHLQSFVNLTGSCNVPSQTAGMDPLVCAFSGSWSPQETKFQCNTESQQSSGLQGTLHVKPQEDSCLISATIPVAYLARYCTLPMPLAGKCSLTMATTITQPLKDCSLTLTTDAITYQTSELPQLQTTMRYQDELLQGPLTCTYHDALVATGTLTFDYKNMCLQGAVTNAHALALPEQWKIPAHGINCSYHYQQGTLNAEYQGIFQHPTFTQERTITGTLQATPQQFLLKGTRGILSYLIEGAVHDGVVSLDFAFRDGNIRIPYTYNLLQDLQGKLKFALPSRRLTATDISLTLHKGTISIAQADAWFNDAYELEYVSLPCMVDNCFLGIKKDVFSLVSGFLHGTYQKNKPVQVNGFLALDRAHIRNNILSDEFLKTLLQQTTAPQAHRPEVSCAVDILTATPLRVKTPFLEAAADAHLKMVGDMTSPSVTGAITLKHGSFLFPYKPLLIKRGTIYFLPQQIDDPVIDIVAENNIRKYAVRMTVAGTAKNSRISFDATPSLQEEQAIALLLGGSEDGSLFLAMPHAVTNSIEKLLFGPAGSTSQFQRALKNIFSPLKNLRVTPSFSDQTARGGLRGSLIIDVNDRLRGIIEHNFSLPEDVVIQVECDLSDDARIRAIKDERGDLGAELEGRWKF